MLYRWIRVYICISDDRLLCIHLNMDQSSIDWSKDRWIQKGIQNNRAASISSSACPFVLSVFCIGPFWHTLSLSSHSYPTLSPLSLSPLTLTPVWPSCRGCAVCVCWWTAMRSDCLSGMPTIPLPEAFIEKGFTLAAQRPSTRVEASSPVRGTHTQMNKHTHTE